MKGVFHLAFVATGSTADNPVSTRCDECGAESFYVLVAGVFGDDGPVGAPCAMCQPCAKKKAALMMKVADNLPAIVRGEYKDEEKEGGLPN